MKNRYRKICALLIFSMIVFPVLLSAMPCQQREAGDHAEHHAAGTADFDRAHTPAKAHSSKCHDASGNGTGGHCPHCADGLTDCLSMADCLKADPSLVQTSSDVLIYDLFSVGVYLLPAEIALPPPRFLVKTLPAQSFHVYQNPVYLLTSRLRI